MCAPQEWLAEEQPVCRTFVSVLRRAALVRAAVSESPSAIFVDRPAEYYAVVVSLRADNAVFT
jgi:hypothetical protein